MRTTEASEYLDVSINTLKTIDYRSLSRIPDVSPCPLRRVRASGENDSRNLKREANRMEQATIALAAKVDNLEHQIITLAAAVEQLRAAVIKLTKEAK